MKEFLKKHWLIILILVLAAALRLYALDRGDAISDEVLYGFRAIGMLDFDFAVAQPTTWQLFHGTVPTWAHLSFHDHPPLVFLVQHWFMQVFGANLWGMRLPSALFGIGSLLCIYWIGKKLFSEKVGIIAAAIMAVNVLMVYVSRTGVQESQVIFFTLLTVYFFLKALDNSRYWFAVGTALGLGLISKYTAGFVVVPLLVYVALFRRDVLKQWQGYAAAGIAFLIFSPVIIYNIMLYRTFGHFDFQFFYLFGQKVSYWQVTPGKEIGSIADRFVNFFKNLWLYNSNVFNALAAAAVVVLGVQLTRWRKLEDRQKKSLAFVGLLVAGYSLLYLVIGPSPRFLTLIIPWLALCIGVLFEWLLSRGEKKAVRRVFIISYTLLVAFESFFSINSYIVYQPIGVETLTYSRIHWDEHAWGFNELDGFIRTTVAGAYPKLIVPYSLSFLEDVKSSVIVLAQSRHLTPKPILFIYSDNMANLGSLWTINRHSLYEAWPMITVQSYQKALTEKGDSFYRDAGFTDFYFIQNTDKVLSNTAERLTDDPRVLEEALRSQHIQPVSIVNHAGKEAFRVYHFE